MLKEDMQRFIKENIDFNSLKKNLGIYETKTLDGISLGVSLEQDDFWKRDVYTYNLFAKGKYIHIDSVGALKEPVTKSVLDELVDKWNFLLKGNTIDDLFGLHCDDRVLISNPDKNCFCTISNLTDKKLVFYFKNEEILTLEPKGNELAEICFLGKKIPNVIKQIADGKCRVKEFNELVAISPKEYIEKGSITTGGKEKTGVGAPER